MQGRAGAEWLEEKGTSAAPRAARPHGWLFLGRDPVQPMTTRFSGTAVLVRQFNKPRTAPYLRITVVTEDDVRRLIAAAVLILSALTV